MTAKGGVGFCFETASWRVPRGTIKVNRLISRHCCFQVELNQEKKDEVAVWV